MTDLTVIQKLNTSVSSVLSASDIVGFERAYLVAQAAGELQALLTAEYMKPIMALQGNRLGFKTDKDTAAGYPEATVKNCLIEAVLMGVQPCGNQFNIIAGNCYLTKEGVGYLLKNIEGLSYDIVFQLPRVSNDRSSAAIEANLEWTINGVKKTKTLPIPVKMNAQMGTDAVIGKATRKARKWLYDTITGSELPEGDAQDVEVLSTKINKPTGEEKEIERMAMLINDCTTAEELGALKPNLPEQLTDLFNAKLDGLK
jgi:hypothetical protein